LCCIFVCFPADCFRILPSLFWFWKSGLEPCMLLHKFRRSCLSWIVEVSKHKNWFCFA
jgi:hypothetical protein